MIVPTPPHAASSLHSEAVGVQRAAVRLEGIFASYWEDLCLMSREFSKLEAELSPGVSDNDPNGLAMLGRLRHFVQFSVAVVPNAGYLLHTPAAAADCCIITLAPRQDNGSHDRGTLWRNTLLHGPAGAARDTHSCRADACQAQAATGSEHSWQSAASNCC
eukprot:21053-Heterococcus_DN1.PRE.3